MNLSRSRSRSSSSNMGCSRSSDSLSSGQMIIGFVLTSSYLSVRCSSPNSAPDGRDCRGSGVGSVSQSGVSKQLRECQVLSCPHSFCLLAFIEAVNH
ncbi:hypothetical protein BCR37DRAFT_378234 [Protomyces lactucae-debilis]|uniref:Uncharacterized protein n=1 Tax=Protomyces lactucae-debilis TaxID=2754530 RepID=A0A1Y2FJU7_PROLT|nr:uncharacterized protein BCR37DRAFT_378234 [Protomyces lactucae-debilis]ORY84233.1 hypothetical protein BCR37DRAFT_378234 [Protomyces lactucae-debilis]